MELKYTSGKKLIYNILALIKLRVVQGFIILLGLLAGHFWEKSKRLRDVVKMFRNTLIVPCWSNLRYPSNFKILQLLHLF